MKSSLSSVFSVGASVCFAIIFLPSVTPFVNPVGGHTKLRVLSNLRSTVDDSIKLESWDNFVKYHVGKWCGIQSSHYHLDEEQSSASEKILCGTFLTLNDQKIDHTNFYVSSPVDFESDAEISTDRIEMQNVAQYQKPTLSSKVCGSVAMGGPGMSREGLSLQFSFRHEDCRMRVMVAFEPLDFSVIPSTSIKVPCSLTISDVTISREKMLLGTDTAALTLPPAKTFTDSVPHFLWRKTQMDTDFGGKYAGVKDTYQDPSTPLSDRIKTEVVPLSALSFYEDFEENLDAALQMDNVLNERGSDDDEDLEFVKVYDGGLLIEAPLVIEAGEEADVKITWSVPNSGEVSSEDSLSSSRTVYIAEATFTAMNDALNKTRRKRRGDSFLDQPVLKGYTVQTLKREQ